MVDSTNLPEIDINAIVTDLNNKADRDLVNSIPPYVVSRTPNSQGGVVEIWSDGYYVETGRTSNFTNTGEATGEKKTITLSNPISTLKTFSANLAIDYTIGNGSNNGFAERVLIAENTLFNNRTLYIHQWTLRSAPGTSCIAVWRAEGYIR